MNVSLEEKVYAIVKKIPKGKITTYKAIAHKLKTKAYRAVGTALKNNKNPIIIPCHRVVKSDGSVGGYSGGVKEKIKLLEKEGFKIKGKRIMNFKERIWF